MALRVRTVSAGVAVVGPAGDVRTCANVARPAPHGGRRILRNSQDALRRAHLLGLLSLFHPPSHGYAGIKRYYASRMRVWVKEEKEEENYI